ncbi:MAG: M23 family metallopeptidase, partial [Alicyclobacillaceae bacterium]|nr:M23 family metallopeptidase [Alicyclobacillaceae bacterium]
MGLHFAAAAVVLLYSCTFATPPVLWSPEKEFTQTVSATSPVPRWSRECGIPLPWAKAVWAYESHIRLGKHTRVPGPKAPLWYGLGNPGQDHRESMVRLFGGAGRDGDGDGLCDQRNPSDRTYAVLCHLAQRRASTPIEIRRGLWEWYGDGSVLERITAFSTLLSSVPESSLQTHAFPLPPRSHYTYRNTWGDPRGWGGRRIHVGTDLFAAAGTPVRSTVWGYVETKGWNPYGGWRIGIRDLNNSYHYFAHLSGYAKGLQVGQIVRPGQIIGYVGNSGYGRKGTA